MTIVSVFMSDPIRPPYLRSTVSTRSESSSIRTRGRARGRSRGGNRGRGRHRGTAGFLLEQRVSDARTERAEYTQMRSINRQKMIDN